MGLRRAIHDSMNEMKKVSWPSRESVVASTKVVIVSTTLFAIFFGVVDYLLTRAMWYIF